MAHASTISSIKIKMKIDSAAEGPGTLSVWLNGVEFTTEVELHGISEAHYRDENGKEIAIARLDLKIVGALSLT